ncbi:hypothetical protein AVEN_126257-1 [Araneus ventricosus]|uniref:ATP-dependent DNA helicase n=1 Tax=Araneus ventricosus TaxID=182803 RepID=A0A4Y2L5G5_ARAVE|nr:hypothetical protein AVEN_126257-1 [Araneus ventricosus]
MITALLLLQAGEEKFAQLYVLDSDLATRRRMERGENSECNAELMRKIDEIIRRVNPFADAYEMKWKLEQLLNGETRERLMAMLNPEQRTIFDTVMNAIRDVDEASPKTFCVNAFTGPGKSFFFLLFNAISRSVRGLGEIAVPVAWTRIAVIILEGGKTAHSRFKLLVSILDNSSSSIRHNTEDGRFLKAAKIII